NSPAPAIHSPPSIVTQSPVWYGQGSESRNAARLATSSGRPKRARGIRPSAFFSASGLASRREKAPSVGIGPGAIAFRRIPACPHSTARDRVIARTPAFAQAEGSANAVPVQAYVVTIDTIAPGAFRASRWRPTAS